MKTKRSKPTIPGLVVVIGLPIIIGCGLSAQPWSVSQDTMARLNATQTAYVSTAIAQGTPQALISPPTISTEFYLTQAVADTQSAKVAPLTSTAYRAQVQTAVAQGTWMAIFPGSTPNRLFEIQQTAFVATAMAQGTPAAAFPTPTPTNTVTQKFVDEVKKINWPTIDWYNLPVLGWMFTTLKDLGGDGLVVAFITAVVTLFLANVSNLIRAIVRLLISIWQAIRRQNKHYVFQQLYLDWLIGQYRHLGLLPAQLIARRWGERQQLVDLEEIYVRLSLSEQADDEIWNNEASFATRWGEHHSIVSHYARLLLLRTSKHTISLFDDRVNVSFAFLSRLSKAIFPNYRYDPGSLSLIIDRTPRLIIRGDPGSGKTTLLRYLAVTCARSNRNNKEEGDSKSLVWNRLDWKTIPFPITIRLSRHSDVISWGNSKTLLDAFRDEMPLDLRRRCPDGFFERLLRRKSCFILLDAYDELGSPKARAFMADYISGFLEAYGKKKHRFVVTTRVVGYEGQLSRLGFTARTVQPLQEWDRNALISNRYKVIAYVEKIGRLPSDMQTINIYLQDREQALIKKLSEVPRLAQLAMNPMLLSLITLVHYLKVELPDERALLYRDCVEILTERWQRFKRDDSGFGANQGDELLLSQKIVLLQEIAYTMQMRRDLESSQALVPKNIAIQVIANALIRTLGEDLSNEGAIRRAEEWIMGVQTDSGILIEQGLDQEGEPLIGFSHLTFQEYLAAVAIKENDNYFGTLVSNLLNPAWREVVRLYVALKEDATQIVHELVKQANQPAGLLLAGWCLTEKVRRIDQAMQLNVLTGLQELFDAEGNYIEEIAMILGNLATIDAIPFLLQTIEKRVDENRQLVVIQSLKYISNTNKSFKIMTEFLVGVLDKDYSVEVRVAAREMLSNIGDPRFLSSEPTMVFVPTVRLSRIRIETYPDLKTFLNRVNSKYEPPFYREVEKRMYLFLRKYIIKSLNYTDRFLISRFPITNLEYQRFVNEKGINYPDYWNNGMCPRHLLTHPVYDISYSDAVDFCNWLSQKNNHKYRLPTEWEWEVASGEIEGLNYPWGNWFDEEKCNTAEGDRDQTTPVGVYMDVKSKYGLQDTAGNVREMVQKGPLLYFELAVLGIFLLLVSISLDAAFIMLVGAAFLAPSLVFRKITKGGSWQDSKTTAKIASRAAINPVNTGFRVVREL